MLRRKCASPCTPNALQDTPIRWIQDVRRGCGQNHAMVTDLTAINAALADLTDAELHALIAASNSAPPVAYGLLVWIEVPATGDEPSRWSRLPNCRPTLRYRPRRMQSASIYD